MVDPANDIVKQAHQGSVAAIIQVLNDKLADYGVRTRAVFSDGVLQLLCEAAKAEQLEQSKLVERVKQTLEWLAPRNIRRVNINCRIVREQQLLWLQEINRDPDHQVLWSEEVTLSKPNLLKQFWEDLKDRQASPEKSALPKPASSRQVREQRQFWRGIAGGVGSSLLLVLLAVGLWRQFGPKQQGTSQADPPNPPSQSPAQTSLPAKSPVPATASPTAKPQSKDPFVEAVRLAEQAATASKTAQSSAEWLALATKWQQASDLMNQVSPKDSRYKTAQNRAVLYHRNSELTLQKVSSQP